MQVRVVTDVSMGIGRGLQDLGRFLDDCEHRGEPVERVDVVAVGRADDGGLRAELELTLSVGQASTASLCDPQVCPDGTVRFALESTTRLLPAADHDVSVEPTGTALDDGGVTVRFAATVPGTVEPAADGEDATVSGDGATVANDDAASSGIDASGTPASAAADRSGKREHVSGERVDASGKGGSTADGDTVGTRTDGDVDGNGDGDAELESAGASERDVPPFKNPDLLAEVYDSCETFAEMADTLEMDVTAETVRRYMIDYDIHEPSTYQTSEPAGAAAADGQVVLSDGIGLPEEVTAEDLIETVERSNTIYEVKQDIDIDRDDALEMLQDLNLLDLVVGRLATEGERDITREDIVDRLREASAVQ
jgi:hypothetical protein